MRRDGEVGGMGWEANALRLEKHLVLGEGTHGGCWAVSPQHMLPLGLLDQGQSSRIHSRWRLKFLRLAAWGEKDASLSGWFPQHQFACCTPLSTFSQKYVLAPKTLTQPVLVVSSPSILPTRNRKGSCLIPEAAKALHGTSGLLSLIPARSNSNYFPQTNHSFLVMSAATFAWLSGSAIQMRQPGCWCCQKKNPNRSGVFHLIDNSLIQSSCISSWASFWPWKKGNLRVAYLSWKLGLKAVLMSVSVATLGETIHFNVAPVIPKL